MGIVKFFTNLEEIGKDPFQRFDVDYMIFSKEILEIENPKFLKNYLTLLETGQPIERTDYAGEEEETEYAHVLVRNVKNGHLFLETPLYINEDKGKALSNYRIEKGDIIIAISANCGAAFFYEGNFDHLQLTLSHYLAKIKVDESRINPRLLVYYLNSQKIQQYFRATETGKTQKNLSKVYIRELPIFLPEDIDFQDNLLTQIAPIEEKIKVLSEKIQAPLFFINQVFAHYYGYDSDLWQRFGKGMTAGTQKSMNRQTHTYTIDWSDFGQSETLRMSSRFHNPLTRELNRLLHTLPVMRIKDLVIEAIRRGVQPRIDAEGSVWAVKTGQLKNGYFDFVDCDMVTNDYYAQNPKAQVQQGDILMSVTGKVSLGKIDFVDFEEEGLADGHITILRIDENRYNKAFLVYFLRSILGAFQIERDYTGTTNQIELYAAEIGNFEIPDIPLSEQAKIVAKISQYLTEQKAIEQEISHLQRQISDLIAEAISEK